MSVSTQRLEGHGNVLHMVIEGEWSPDEWLDVYQKTHDLIGEGGEPAHLIFEYRRARSPSRLISNLPRLREAQTRNEATVNLLISSITVAPRGFLRRVAEIFIKVYPRDISIHLVETMDEALEIVKQELAEIQ